jgi:pyruvate/2-oxoglutarate dehydrogenase complex dihydrolipoamide dehydrogenase (E3) component
MAAENVLILGAGSSGESCASALRELEPATPVTIVEQGLVGGECSYFACMPSKALLRPVEALHAATLVPGAAEAVTGRADPQGVFSHRDAVVENLDDGSQAEWLESKEIELVRGTAGVVSPGVVRVADRELRYGRLVVATGSVPAIPRIPGIDDVDIWTNRQATTAHEIPESLVVLGAGPVGCELAQFYARMGTRVSIVDMAERLLPRDDPAAGELIAEVFTNEGISLHLGGSVARVEAGIVVRLESGEEVRGERLIVATGRTANTERLGLEQLGVRIGKRGVEVDESMRAAENVWAIGDVNGIAMFTHAGKYQARIAAADIAGLSAKADHRAVPAVTFTDPQVASVGTFAGDGLVSGEQHLDKLSRTSTYERPKRRGFLKVLADPKRGVLVGAVAVGPEAGEWLGQLTLAIRAEVPLEVLEDTIQPYPTFSEAVQFAVRDLPL